MGQNVVKQRLEHAEKTGVLTLTKCGIDNIPPDCLRLRSNLRNLDLSQNKIQHLPSFIGQFVALKQLSVEGNRISVLPEEFGSLVHLESLVCSHNPLNRVPESFSRLMQLKVLHLASCQFTEIPKVFCLLPRLDLLDLSANKISSVPSHISGLNAVELNLNQNQLAALSNGLAQCKRLKVLRVEENCLTLDIFSKEILADSQISLLAIDGNLFDSRDLRHRDGYEKYMERFTATKKKMF